MKEVSIKELKNAATRMRMNVVDMIYKAQSGHPGGSLSAADFVTACYFKYMNLDPQNPRWPDRDRMVLSKGHVCPIQYACLAAAGFFPVSELDTLRKADFIFREEVAAAGIASDMGQYFAVLTNMRSVGVMGDGRTYDYTLALRSVTTTDFMTADWTRIPYEVLDRVSVRVVNEAPHINRVLYDITSKPPATIEWE